MAKRAASLITGDQLMSYFTDAINTLVLAETAKHQARQAEEQVQSQLKSSPAHNQLYITPSDLGQDVMDALAKQSLDAHLKNVQSSQLAVATEERLQDLQATAEKQFVGKKVRVSILQARSTAINSILTNRQTGQQRLGKRHPPIVLGKVQEVSLRDNILLIRPTFTKRWLTPQLTAYVVYPLNVSDLKPAVSIST